MKDSGASAEIVPAYFDSALIAKYYLKEPGRDQVRRLARQAGVVLTSGIALAEVSGAFHRKFLEGATSEDAFSALQGQFLHDLASRLWTAIEPMEAILQEVQILYTQLDKSEFLQALDALHLVTGKTERFDRLYTNDRHLLIACRALGVEGINPFGNT